jgi:nitrate/nitrite transporter NarK
VPALLCGFAVWGMWGIITVQMMNLGFPFTQAELFTLTAISGIAGATMRIPASFLIRLAGGRNTIFLTTAMLLAPAIGTGIVLQHPEWPLWAFQLMALWCGVGGGNFASSMSNISTFFPKRLQGTALGLNAGLGNFGVTTMQIVIPLVMTLGLLRQPGRRADDAAQGQRLDLRQDRRRHAHLDPERRLCLGAVAGAAVHPVLVRHEQPQDGLARHRQPARGLRQDHLAVHAGLHPVHPRPVPVPAQAHRPGPDQHVGGDSAGHRQRAADHEAGRLRPHEGGVASSSRSSATSTPGR